VTHFASPGVPLDVPGDGLDKRGAQRLRDCANCCADDRLNGKLPGTSPVAVTVSAISLTRALRLRARQNTLPKLKCYTIKIF